MTEKKVNSGNIDVKVLLVGDESSCGSGAEGRYKRCSGRPKSMETAALRPRGAKPSSPSPLPSGSQMHLMRGMRAQCAFWSEESDETDHRKSGISD